MFLVLEVYILCKKGKDVVVYTSAMADVTMFGMGCVVSPMPKLMTLASGYFFSCASRLMLI